MYILIDRRLIKKTATTKQSCIVSYTETVIRKQDTFETKGQVINQVVKHGMDKEADDTGLHYGVNRLHQHHFSQVSTS